MIASFPQVHATLLGLAAFGAVACAGVLLASNAKSRASQLHYVYALCLAWWFVCQAMIATADSIEGARRWGHLAHLTLGMLPAVIYHLNVSLIGLAERYQARIRAHWGGSVGLTAFALLSPSLFMEPSLFAWGGFMRYTWWGVVVAAPLLVVFIEVFLAYRVALNEGDPRSAQYQKTNVFFRGNMFASLALVDFLPAFGLAVYPFGYAVISVMHVITLYGSVRYRLIQMTPEFAAEHVLDRMPDGLLLIDTRGRVQVANQPAAACLGCEPGDLIGRQLGTWGQDPDVVEQLRRLTSDGSTTDFSYMDPRRGERRVRASLSLISDQLGFRVATLWALHDITAEHLALEEKKYMEEGVRSMQKLESLGVLARGIAHDFNNLLLGIAGNAELAGLTAVDNPELQEHLRKIELTVDQASELTGQMLTYTGDVPMHQRPTDLNHVVADVAGLMAAAISKKATLTLDLHPGLPDVVADPSQLSQVILNLIVNGSESMRGEIGSVYLRTGILQPDGTFHRWRDDVIADGPTDHVFLEVRDNGTGMDEETLRQIFDPFFTTKFTGRGLGLATVVGIVRAHGGMTRVTSAPGRGTTFTVVFPIAAESHASLPPAGARRTLRADGLVLLADDEPEVRSVTRTMLTRAGFQVIEASDGAEAVSEFEARAEEIVLVVLDRTMPVLDGREAFARIRTLSSDVPVIFISGYTDAHLEPLDSRTAFLHKPFKTSTLAAKIQEAMTA